ncbi:Uncharacterized protein, isoform A [Gryllus bimaculatus]|nr:Uncharacterized protein, isoform A [Gryllus bimaculatus]
MLLHEMCLENYFREIKPQSDDDCEEEECRNNERFPGCQSFNDTLQHEHGSYVRNERRGNDVDEEEERIWKERNKSSPGRKTRYDILPHEKRQRGFHKGIQESNNKNNENVGGRPLSILSPGPRRTMSLFDLRSHKKKIIECPSDFGRSMSTMCLPSQSQQSCKARSPCSEEHSPEPCAGPSRESPRPGPSSFLAGPSKEFSRPGPSSFLAGPSKESSRPGASSFLAELFKESSRPGPSSFLAGLAKESLRPGPSLFLAGPSIESPRPGPSSFLAGPSKESPRPGPSSPHAGTSRESPMSGPISPRAGPSRESPGPRPASPPLIHRSQFLEYLKQELIKQKLALKGPVLKSSAYFGQGPPNHLPLNQWLLDQGPLKRSLNKEPSNQASPNKEPVNQSSPSRRPSQAHKPDEENRKPDLRNFTFGLRLDIICNHVRLDIITGKGIFEYVVDFFPQENNQFFKNQMVRQHEEELGDALFFNGESLFLSTERNEESYFECIHPTSDTRVKMSLKCKGRATDTDAEEIFNMVFRKIMTNLGVKNVGYRFLDPLGSINLTHYGLEIWPVIFSCVKKFDGGLQVCVNASNCVIHSKSVLELINRIRQGNPCTFQEECLKLIVGATVVTRYNHKMYEVYDICWDKHPESTFTTNQGNQISFFEYYLNHHQITVQDMGQPLLLANVTKTTDILKKNCQEELGNDMSQRLLSAWGFEVDAFPLRLEARVLNQETIWYKNARIDLTAGQTRWSVDHQLLITKQLRNWAILYLEDDKRLAQNLECNLRFVAGSMDMRIYPGKLIQVPENSTESYLHTLRCITDQLLQLVIFLFRSAQSDRYSAVKRFCCIDQPRLSQVILTQTLRNTFKIRTVIKNLVMQINCKLGGALWSLTVPFGKLMVCGINIFPDTSRKCLVMGFVASTNPLQLSWHSKVGFGASIEEFGDTLYLGMLSALRKYKEVSGVLPDRILVYREGISDEQLGLIDEIDIPNFRRSFRDAAVQYQPKLTVVVCQRKVMTRLMAVEETCYAHRLARLVGEHLHEEPSPTLSDKLYFI